MDPREIIESQCDGARDILDHFGAEKAMGYLIGEKFLNFLEVAETNPIALHPIVSVAHLFSGKPYPIWVLGPHDHYIAHVVAANPNIEDRRDVFFLAVAEERIRSQDLAMHAVKIRM